MPRIFKRLGRTRNEVFYTYLTQLIGNIDPKVRYIYILNLVCRKLRTQVVLRPRGCFVKQPDIFTVDCFLTKA